MEAEAASSSRAAPEPAADGAAPPPLPAAPSRRFIPPAYSDFLISDAVLSASPSSKDGVTPATEAR
jgi:hypothetical protein